MRLRDCVAMLAMLLLPATSTAAPGIAMRWDQCYGDGGVSNKNFACDTNAGSETLVLSVRPPADLQLVNGDEIKVTLMTTAASLPPWWAMRTNGSCRQNALRVNAIANPSDAVCVDEFAGNATSGIGSYDFMLCGNTNRARLSLAVAVPGGSAVTLTKDHEYFLANIVIDHTKTVGAGACAGCVTPTCLVFSNLRLTLNDGSVAYITDPVAPNSDVATWQQGSPSLAYVPVPYTFSGCFTGGWLLESCGLPTPARNQTWGAIKSLYR